MDESCLPPRLVALAEQFSTAAPLPLRVAPPRPTEPRRAAPLRPAATTRHLALNPLQQRVREHMAAYLARGPW
jgi:hypothetical protein